MASPTAINRQIVDAVTPADEKVLDETPAQALGILYEEAAQDAGQEIEKAVSNQQNIPRINNAAVGEAVNTILKYDADSGTRGELTASSGAGNSTTKS